MITYKYKAQDDSGKVISGKLAAVDEIDLHERLKADNKYLIEATEVRANKGTKRLKANEVSEFSRNIGKLIGAGVTLVKALRITSEDESTPPAVRRIYSNMLKLVRTGMSLSEAMAEQGDAFPILYINMIKSAEASGNMDSVCMQMADYYDKEYQLSGKIKSSMNYPKILLGLIVAVVIIIMAYVLPQFESLFAQMESLPLPTRILMATSDFIVQKWYMVLLGAAVLVILFIVISSIPQVQFMKDKLLIHLPLVGKLMQVIYTARFARTLSSLYSAGLSILNCLTIAKTTVGNKYIESQFDKVISDIRSGDNLSEAISKVDGFTGKLASIISVGEETGALDSMLLSVANQLEFESEMALNRLVSYLEPAMIVVMAVIVGFIMIAVIQPIYGSYQSIADMK